MAEVRWTPQAADDLDAIAEFIAKDSPNYAGLFVDRIIESVEQLRDHPQMGRVVPEVGDASIRERILGDYRVIYRTRNDLIEILTVFHGAKLIDVGRLGFRD